MGRGIYNEAIVRVWARRRQPVRIQRNNILDAKCVRHRALKLRMSHLWPLINDAWKLWWSLKSYRYLWQYNSLLWPDWLLPWGRLGMRRCDERPPVTRWRDWRVPCELTCRAYQRRFVMWQTNSRWPNWGFGGPSRVRRVDYRRSRSSSRRIEVTRAFVNSWTRMTRV